MELKLLEILVWESKNISPDLEAWQTFGIEMLRLRAGLQSEIGKAKERDFITKVKQIGLRSVVVDILVLCWWNT